MRIVVRRTGGIAGLSRRWQVDTESCDDPSAWDDLVAALPDAPPGTAPGVRDDFEWTVTLAQRTVRIAGSRLDGPWADLVGRVRQEGGPA